MLILMGGAVAVQDAAWTYARDGYVKLYRSCLDKNVSSLDDGRASVEAIVRASMFACSAEHDAVRTMVRSTVQDEMSKNDAVLGNDTAFDSDDAATAEIKTAMDGLDKAAGDRLAYLILRKRGR